MTTYGIILRFPSKSHELIAGRRLHPLTHGHSHTYVKVPGSQKRNGILPVGVQSFSPLEAPVCIRFMFCGCQGHSSHPCRVEYCSVTLHGLEGPLLTCVTSVEILGSVTQPDFLIYILLKPACSLPTVLPENR